MTENLALAKKLNIGATIVSLIVFALVVMMRRIKIETNIDFTFLPPLYSTLNAIAAICLMAAFYFIKNKNVNAHKNLMTTALVISILFLLCYVVYHITTPETSFCKEGNIRIVYFVLLISHIVLAAVILPFILFTFIRAYTGQYERHRKMAKWVYPLWLYVAITGPVIYLMLKPCYGL